MNKTIIILILLTACSGPTLSDNVTPKEIPEQNTVSYTELKKHCSQKCDEAENEECSLESLANLCLSGTHQILNSGEFIDFNKNNIIDYDFKTFGGEGMCEDQIYCFSEVGSCCEKEVHINGCADILETYWNQKGWVKGSEERTELCESFQQGSCTPPNNNNNISMYAWWNVEGFTALCP